MDRFFKIYNSAVRWFAILCLAFAVGYFLFWIFFTKGLFGAVDLVVFGKERDRPNDTVCLESPSLLPPFSEESPSLTL